MNIAKEVTIILDYIEKYGWNGRRLEDWNREGIWHQEYAIFTALFRPKRIFYEDGCKCQDRIALKFKEFLNENFLNSTINHYSGCYEYEIIGRNYKEFADKYRDQMEEIAVATDDHIIFEPRNEAVAD